ncbi:cephalosporin hydroxylase [Bisbaumannia pacifica]|uniref:Cephalosporin hydroxylase n=1 Tax=Bisbaumannia pacifica TaxID=77098 RepID=A0A510X9R2_9GAMM|nr:cephalosporin hydroxylase family protein [Halomonas pacifica]GEK48178.1 cephalosporin hydroxylase [Halomonas pacifica]
MVDPIAGFEEERRHQVSGYSDDASWKMLSHQWLERAFQQRYMYNFNWLGRPIIQTPTDIVAVQELIWEVNPDVVVETGIAHGGSLMLSASMLALLDYREAIDNGTLLDPNDPKRRVIGIDIDIRRHNLDAIRSHPMSNRIDMIEGSSIDAEVIGRVKRDLGEDKKVLVMLDSNHTHDHVLSELETYAPLVSKGSYCIVFDTLVEDLPESCSSDRPWGPGNNPKTAIKEFLESHSEFEVDKYLDDKLMVSAAPLGFLKKVR